MLQLELEEILRKKGIGPQGSKSLKMEDLDRVSALLRSSEVSMTTRCTVLLALLLLDKTEDEAFFLSKLRQSVQELELPLQKLILLNRETFEDTILSDLLEKQDISGEHCKQAMDLLFHAATPSHWKGCFLEGERLKRENAEENASFFKSLWERCYRVQTDLPLLIDIADNYDGFNRYFNYSLFLAPTLAAAGYPAYLHGMHEVAPKFGYTAHQLLQLAGKQTQLALADATAELKNIGWTYVDQAVFFPSLFALATMRKEMVKRPFLATFEKLLQPIRAAHGNSIICGYTHSHYKDEVIQQLKDLGTCKEALVIKGLEGNPQLPLARATTVMHFDGASILEDSASPEHASLELQNDRIERPARKEDVLEEGLQALKGKDNEARKRILYMAWLLASKFNLENPATLTEKVKSALDSGKALEYWNSKK